MYNVGDLYEVDGEQLILKEQDNTSYLFWARKFNRHINKEEFVHMVESGEATLIRTTGKEAKDTENNKITHRKQ